MPDITTQTSAGVPYVSKRYHRDGTSQKSQWKRHVTVAIEVGIFQAAFQQGEDTAWGYHLSAGSPAPLGTSAAESSPVIDLMIAKFNGQNNPTVWSGYPADYRRKIQDRPPAPVLNTWQELGVIAKHEISRIRGGKKCSLSK